MEVVSPLQEVRTKPSKRHKDKSVRFCQKKDCTTKLSVYNLTSYCSIHEKLFSSQKDFI